MKKLKDLFKRIKVEGSQDEKFKRTLHYRAYSNEERIKMSKYCEENGWTDLHHWNNWVKKEWFGHPTLDIDRAGSSLISVYKHLIKQK